jgi:1-acyl-sn-glycerol-3-phosphate acyltransferase
MASVLRSLAFYAVFYGATVLFLLASAAMLPVGGDAFRAVPNGWSAFHRWCVRHILGIRVIEQGARPAVQAFYAFKHESFFEAIDLARSLRNPVAFAKAELFDIPLWGRAARAYGMVPVARKEGAKALRFMLAEARRLEATGRPFIIFPEGTRVPHGASPRLRSGFAGLYQMLELPVVPVAVDSGRTYAGRWKRRGTITLRFGEPIPPGLTRAEIEARVHAGINALNGAE